MVALVVVTRCCQSAAAVVAALRFALLFHLELLAQDGGNLALHERPRYRRVGQGALFAAGAVHLGAGALSLDALAAAREAELVVSHRGALHKVGIFEPFLAQGTLEGGVRCGSRCSSGATARNLLLAGSVDSGTRSGWTTWAGSTVTATTSGRSNWADGTRGQSADDVLTLAGAAAAGLGTGLRWLG